jgi:hypothetical protein
MLSSCAASDGARSTRKNAASVVSSSGSWASGASRPPFKGALRLPVGVADQACEPERLHRKDPSGADEGRANLKRETGVAEGAGKPCPARVGPSNARPRLQAPHRGQLRQQRLQSHRERLHCANSLRLNDGEDRQPAVAEAGGQVVLVAHHKGSGVLQKLGLHRLDAPPVVDRP